MGVLEVVGEGRIGLGGGKGDSSGGVGLIGGAIQVGGNGTERDNRPGMRAESTKYQLNTIEVHILVPL